MRDLGTNLLAGDGVDAALDAAGLIPVIGKIGDGAKAAKVIAKWVKKFPAKTAQASRVIGRYVISKAPTESFDKIYSALGKGNDYRRLVTDGGIHTDTFRKLVKDNLDDINSIERGAGKLDKPLTISDVETAFTDSTGTTVVLLRTDKWKNLDKVARNGPGFNHIVARHVEKGTSGFEDFAVEAGSKVYAKGEKATTFPPEMGPDDIKKSIEVAAKNGNTAGAKITYTGSKLDPLPVDEMTVIRAPDNGNIITAFPAVYSDTR